MLLRRLGVVGVRRAQLACKARVAVVSSLHLRPIVLTPSLFPVRHLCSERAKESSPNSRSIEGGATSTPPPFETLAMEPEWYKKLDCMFDKTHSSLLEELAKCEVRHIDADGSSVDASSSTSVVGVISFNNDFPVLDSLAPQLIYERPFYPKLLETIRSHNTKKVLLVGNPGISKSFFQLYYLARILNPEKFGPLPPDHKGSTAPPKIVIRQVGNSEMFIFDIEHRRAEKYRGLPGKVLDCFDPSTTIYMMEPDETLTGPYFKGNIMPILFTASPNESRYKEFVKSGAAKLYMPTYERNELLGIGAYLLKNGFVPEGLAHLYSAESIRERCEQFGGIIRHVLPISKSALTNAELKQAAAITDCDCKKLLYKAQIEDKTGASSETHFIMQYFVATEGEEAFLKPYQDFISSDIVNRLNNKLTEIEFKDKVYTLRKNDEIRSHMEHAVPKFFEDVIAELLHRGVRWKRRIVRGINTTKKRVLKKTPKEEKTKTNEEKKLESSAWQDFNEKVRKVAVGEHPKFDEMKPNIIYKPTNVGFPFCEFFYKSDDNKLVLFQLTRQMKGMKIVSLSALKTFLDKVGVPVEDAARRLRVVLVPKRETAGKICLQLSNDDELENRDGLEAALAMHEVWAHPFSYDVMFDEDETVPDIDTNAFKEVDSSPV